VEIRTHRAMILILSAFKCHARLDTANLKL
jgi:hypothetical protein